MCLAGSILTEACNLARDNVHALPPAGCRTRFRFGVHQEHLTNEDPVRVQMAAHEAARTAATNSGEDFRKNLDKGNLMYLIESGERFRRAFEQRPRFYENSDGARTIDGTET